jgi:hypothetical protein
LHTHIYHVLLGGLAILEQSLAMKTRMLGIDLLGKDPQQTLKINKTLQLPHKEAMILAHMLKAART